jgi:hypothetical protein
MHQHGSSACLLLEHVHIFLRWIDLPEQPVPLLASKPLMQSVDLVDGLDVDHFLQHVLDDGALHVIVIRYVLFYTTGKATLAAGMTGEYWELWMGQDQVQGVEELRLLLLLICRLLLLLLLVLYLVWPVLVRAQALLNRQGPTVHVGDRRLIGTCWYRRSHLLSELEQFFISLLQLL